MFFLKILICYLLCSIRTLIRLAMIRWLKITEISFAFFFEDKIRLPNTFVDNNTNSMSSYVENTTGFTMIESVWHTFLYGTIALSENRDKNRLNCYSSDEIYFNIDNVTTFVDFHVGSQRYTAIFLEISWK